MLAAADAGQAVVASILGLGAAGVAGAVIAMAWSVHTHQMQLAGRLARREDIGAPDEAVPGHAGNRTNGNGAHGNGAHGAHGAHGNGVHVNTGGPAKAANGGDSEPRPGGGAAVASPAGPGAPPTRPGPSPAPPSVIEGPDSVVIGEQARYRVRRSGTQQVVSWAAGGGSVSQASDPAHPDDLLLVADRPGNLMVSVRLREGLAERRETKAVTAVANQEAPAPAAASRVLLQDWPLITVAVLVVGFAAALAALGSLAAGDFIALAAPLAALLAVVAMTRRPPERPGR